MNNTTPKNSANDTDSKTRFRKIADGHSANNLKTTTMSSRKNKSNDINKELWLFVSKNFHKYLEDKVKEIGEDLKKARNMKDRETAMRLLSEQMVFQGFVDFSHVLKNHELKALINQKI